MEGLETVDLRGAEVVGDSLRTLHGPHHADHWVRSTLEGAALRLSRGGQSPWLSEPFSWPVNECGSVSQRWEPTYGHVLCGHQSMTQMLVTLKTWAQNLW